MSHIDEETLRARIQSVLQELEGEATGDLVVSYVVMLRTTGAEPDSDAYRLVTDGSIAEQLGLLRAATIRVEEDVRT